MHFPDIKQEKKSNSPPPRFTLPPIHGSALHTPTPLPSFHHHHQTPQQTFSYSPYLEHNNTNGREEFYFPVYEKQPHIYNNHWLESKSFTYLNSCLIFK